MFEKMKRLANTSIIFHSSSDVIMTSLTIKKQPIGHIGSAILNWSNAFHLLKTRINRGNSDRKIDLFLKDAYRKPQNPQVTKFPEEWTLLKNWTKHLPLGHFAFMFIFSNRSLKCLDYTNSWNKLKMYY